MRTFSIPKLGPTEELRGKLASVYYTLPNSPIDTVFRSLGNHIGLLRERGCNIYPFHDYHLGPYYSRPSIENIIWNEPKSGVNAGMLVGTVVENHAHNVENVRHIQDVSWTLVSNYLENKTDMAIFRERHLNFAHAVRRMLDHIRSGSTDFYDSDMEKIDEHRDSMAEVNWEDNNLELEMEILRHRIIRAVKHSHARAGRVVWHYVSNSHREVEIVNFANFLLSFYFRVERGRTGFGAHTDTVTFLEGAPSIYARRRPTQLRSQVREAVYKKIEEMVLAQTHEENPSTSPREFGDFLTVTNEAFFKWHDLLIAADPSRAGTAAAAESETEPPTAPATDGGADTPPTE